MLNREQRRKSRYGAGKWVKASLGMPNVEYLGDYKGICAVCIKREKTFGGGVYEWYSYDSRIKDGSIPNNIALLAPEKGKEDADPT